MHGHVDLGRLSPKERLDLVAFVEKLMAKRKVMTGPHGPLKDTSGVVRSGAGPCCTWDDCKQHGIHATVAGRMCEGHAPLIEGLLMEGNACILEERMRQIKKLKYDERHDEAHINGELVAAALCYLLDRSDGWPWTDMKFKPSSDRLRDLVKAGALISAEIDRLVARRRHAARITGDTKIKLKEVSHAPIPDSGTKTAFEALRDAGPTPRVWKPGEAAEMFKPLRESIARLGEAMHGAADALDGFMVTHSGNPNLEEMMEAVSRYLKVVTFDPVHLEEGLKNAKAACNHYGYDFLISDDPATGNLIIGVSKDGHTLTIPIDKIDMFLSRPKPPHLSDPYFETTGR